MADAVEEYPTGVHAESLGKRFPSLRRSPPVGIRALLADAWDDGHLSAEAVASLNPGWGNPYRTRDLVDPCPSCGGMGSVGGGIEEVCWSCGGSGENL